MKGKGKTVRVHSMKAYRGEERCNSALSLTSALDEGECSASCPDRFVAGKERHFPLNWRLGGPTPGLDIE